MIAPGAAVAPALSLPADYVLLRKATLRNGPKLDSKEVGILQAGYIVNIVGESYQDGHHRLHLPVGVTTSGGGWVSRTTAKGGTLLMAVRERPAAVIYTAINVATVRSCASTGSSELYRVGAGKRVVVLETTTFQGHHRARIGVGEWVSLVTAKGKQLMVMDEQATAELRRRAGGAPTAMAVAVPAVVVAASTPVVATATATAMPVAAQATQAVAAMPAPARAEPAAQPPGAAPVAPDGNVIGTQYLTLSGVRLRKDIAVSSECVGTIGAGQQVTVVEQRDWEGHTRARIYAPQYPHPVWTSMQTAAGQVVLEQPTSAAQEFTVIALATVRNGLDVKKSKETRKLAPGVMVTVLEQGQHGGHLRGRISATEWVSIKSKTKTLLVPQNDAAALAVRYQQAQQAAVGQVQVAVPATVVTANPISVVASATAVATTQPVVATATATPAPAFVAAVPAGPFSQQQQQEPPSPPVAGAVLVATTTAMPGVGQALPLGQPPAGMAPTPSGFPPSNNV